MNQRQTRWSFTATTVTVTTMADCKDFTSMALDLWTTFAAVNSATTAANAGAIIATGNTTFTVINSCCFTDMGFAFSG